MYLITINRIIVGIYQRMIGAKGFYDEFSETVPSPATISRNLKQGPIIMKNIIINTASGERYVADIFKIEKIKINQIININLKKV